MHYGLLDTYLRTPMPAGYLCASLRLLDTNLRAPTCTPMPAGHLPPPLCLLDTYMRTPTLLDTYPRTPTPAGHLPAHTYTCLTLTCANLLPLDCNTLH